MFCSKCGHQNPAGTGFCAGCGNAMAAGGAGPQGGAPTNMGALLASGKGIQSNATMMFAALWGGLAVVSIVLAFVLGFDRVPSMTVWGVTTPAMTFRNSWFAFWIVFAVIELALGVLTVLTVRKTEINVYEGGISGTAASGLFMAGDPRTFNFNLNHKDVALGGTNHQITIKGNGVNYNVFASNAQQIKDIWNQRRQM